MPLYSFVRGALRKATETWAVKPLYRQALALRMAHAVGVIQRPTEANEIRLPIPTHGGQTGADLFCKTPPCCADSNRANGQKRQYC